jgi:hypothetical protein
MGTARLLHGVHGDSSVELPKFRFSGIDVALIDGGHGFPIPHLDFALINRDLKPGSLVIVDDIQLTSPRVLAKNLCNIGDYFFKQPRRSPNGKALIFEKTGDYIGLPDWGGNPLERDHVLPVDEAYRSLFEK